jgi:hypothetical protein
MADVVVEKENVSGLHSELELTLQKIGTTA